MNYLSSLTEEDVHYICDAIPHDESILYFECDPYGFAKIMPGHRAISLKDHSKVTELLFKNRKTSFVSSFLEKNISNWLSKIQADIDELIKNGDSKELALLKTLPSSYFDKNVSLFFRLIKIEHSEEYIKLMNETIILLKKQHFEQNKLIKEIKVKSNDIKKITSEADSTKSELKKIKEILIERNKEIVDLKKSLNNRDSLKHIIQNNEKIISKMEKTINKLNNEINELTEELAKVKEEKQRFETNIRLELEKQKTVMMINQQTSLKPKGPRDIDEFKEFLVYNLEDIGVCSSAVYFPLLKEHLSKILFQGMPIIVGHGVSRNLIKCISNTLVGKSNFTSLTFQKNLSINDIDFFLSSNERIVCLDNFLGNFNETELLTLFDNHKDKIIFLTVAYDRTIHYISYISKEFLRFCHYLNLNRIPELLADVTLKEDPSSMEEIEYTTPRNGCDKQQAIFKEILLEFGFPKSLVEQKSIAIYDDQNLCRMLAFDVLPYCVDVLQIAPYYHSTRMVRYLNNNPGLHHYKRLFEKWFLK